MREREMRILKRVRIRQIQLFSGILRRICALRFGAAAIKAIRALPVMKGFLDALVGYRRPFPTLSDAAAAIAGYEGGGHSNPNYLAVKVPEAEMPRPGDYAALYHLERLTPRFCSVFDVGGSVGNLFYCYSRYLKFSADLRWTVYDLPDTNELGKNLAASKNELRLHFTDQVTEADGVDLLICSGALHYFEPKLSDIIAELTVKPKYLLINRAPLVDVPSFATVQDGGTYRLACYLHNRAALVQGLEDIGYELLDSWDITERSVIVPCYPDWSARTYSGLFFQQKLSVQDLGSQICQRTEVFG